MSGPEVQNLATNPKTQITKPRLTSAVVFSVFVVVFCTSGPLYKQRGCEQWQALANTQRGTPAIYYCWCIALSESWRTHKGQTGKERSKQQRLKYPDFQGVFRQKVKKVWELKMLQLKRKKKSILWNFFTDVQILYGNKVKKKNFWVQSEAELNANTEAHYYLLTRSVHKSLLSLQLMNSWCTECLGRPNIPVVKFVWMKQAGNSLRILSEHTFSPLVRVEIQNHGILHFP